MRRRDFLAASTALVTAPSVGAARRPDIAVPEAFAAHARHARVPARLLYAIALTESCPPRFANAPLPRAWPWTLNICPPKTSPRALYCVSQDAARAAFEEALEATLWVDVGVMQVHWRLHAHRFGGAAARALEPELNIGVGAQYLRECFESSQNWVVAAGRYHSKTPARAARYRERVFQWYARLH